MRYLSLLLLGFCLLRFTPTLLAQTQAEMNLTAGADLERADVKLNSLYQTLLSRHSQDQPFCTDLREAQRAWIKFTEFHLKTLFPLKAGESPREVYGSIYPLSFATAKTELIQQRIKQLEELSDDSSLEE